MQEGFALRKVYEDLKYFMSLNTLLCQTLLMFRYTSRTSVILVAQLYLGRNYDEGDVDVLVAVDLE